MLTPKTTPKSETRLSDQTRDSQEELIERTSESSQQLLFLPGAKEEV
jgi:hypothetical protein